MSQIALDSNILLYLAGFWKVEADKVKIVRAKEIVGRLRKTEDIFAPIQALGELFAVLHRNRKPIDFSRKVVLEFSEGFGVANSSATTLAAAMDLVVDHQLQFWDALIVTAATEAGCSLLLSEDMHDGFVSRGLTIVNPLADTLHPQLARLLDSPA